MSCQMSLRFRTTSLWEVIVLYCPLYASYTYNLNRAIHKWRKHTAYPELFYWPTFSTLNVWQAHPHTCKHAVASVIRLSCNGTDRAWHSSPSEKLKMKNSFWITGEVHSEMLSLIPFHLSFIWQIQSKSPLSRMVLSCWPRERPASMEISGYKRAWLIQDRIRNDFVYSS